MAQWTWQFPSTPHRTKKGETQVMRVIHKTANGWLITGERYSVDPDDMKNCFAFESMRTLTAHLMKLAGEVACKAAAKKKVKR